MSRIFIVALAALLASLLGPSAIANASDEQGPDAVYFEQTGQYLANDFLEFWREHGGIRTFGYPITPVMQQDGITVQYFERHVMEHHPDNPDDYHVLLRRLGAEARDDRGISDRGPFDPQEDDESGQFFPASQQNMKDGFLSYWERNGGTRVFGYPISTQFRHYGTVVQFTERAILEYHPDNPSGWRILSELLGAQAAERDGVITSPQEHDGETPQYQEDLWQVPEPEPEPQAETRSFAPPSQLRIDKIGVNASFEHLGFDAAGRMAAPHGWNNVSWFNRGPLPGERGNAAVAGHLDAPGGVPAIFWNLNQLVPGDRVTVISENGDELVFQVTAVEQFYVGNEPTRRIFGSTDQRNMNLITCAGYWNTSMGTYDQRLVVYTTLVE